MQSAFFELLKSGSLTWQAFAVSVGKRVEPAESRIVAVNDFMLHWQCIYPDWGREDLYFSVNRDRTSVNCRRVWTTGDKPCKLDELGIVISGIHFGKRPADDYYYKPKNSERVSKLPPSAKSNLPTAVSTRSRLIPAKLFRLRH